MASLGHCPTCDRSWGGLGEAHCGGARGCHKQFGSDYAFDRHRTGDPADGRRCMTTEELAKPREWRGKVGKPTLVTVERKGGTYFVSSVYVRAEA